MDSNLHSPERRLIELRIEHGDLDALIDRLAAAVATPAMKVVVEGGGIAEPFTFGLDHMLLVGRGDVEYALQLLREGQTTLPTVVEPLRVGSEGM